jgi:hypothetical protein
MKKSFVQTVGIAALLVVCVSLAIGIGWSHEQPQQPAQTTASSTIPPAAQPAPPTAVSPPVPSTVSTPATPSVGPQNIGQIQVGMTSQQVLKILGNPRRIKQEAQYTEWEYYGPQGKCEVKLQNDKVVRV